MKESLLKIGLVVNNQFLEKYVELINQNKNTPKKKFETQKHHIIPKYYFKHNKLEIDNSKTNWVNLSHSNHLLAHYYLYLCSSETYKTYSGYAFNRLCTPGNKEFKIDLVPETIEGLDVELFNKSLQEVNNQKSFQLKEKYRKGLRKSTISQNRSNPAGKIFVVNQQEERHLIPLEEFNFYKSLGYVKGKYFDKKLNPRWGSKLSESTKAKISQKHLGRYSPSKTPDLTNQKRSKSLKKVIKTPEWKQKIRDTLRKKSVWTNGKITVIQEESPGPQFYKGRPKNPKIQQRIWVTNGQIQHWIDKKDLEKYLKLGFYRGHLPRKSTVL